MLLRACCHVEPKETRAHIGCGVLGKPGASVEQATELQCVCALVSTGAKVWWQVWRLAASSTPPFSLQAR